MNIQNFHKSVRQMMILGVLLTAVAMLPAQTPDNRKLPEQFRDLNPQLQREQVQFRMAQTYQNMNDHERAVGILQQLYEKHPGNLQYYEALLKSLLQLGRYSEANQLIDRQNATDPGNQRYTIDRAEVLYHSGEKKKALDTWQRLVRENPHDIALLNEVANTMIRNQLYDEAVEVYQTAYQNNPTRTYFLQNIASLYRSRLEYRKALEYYLKYLDREPQNFQVVARQVLSFQLDESRVDSLLDVLKAGTKKYRNNRQVQLLLAKFYQKYQRYEEALAIYQQQEDERSRGKFLLEFGQTALGDSAYDLALRAFTELIERFPDSPHVYPAYLGAAQANLALARQQNDQAKARQALQIIETVRQKYPNHPQLASLSLLEGRIYREFFFDIDRAVELFLKIAKQYKRNSQVSSQANLYAGECLIIRGDLSQAREVLQQVSAPQYKPQALYYLSKIAFFDENYTAAQEYLDQILKLEGIGGDLTNDAIELQLLLSRQNDAGEILPYLAQADWLIWQEKKSEAISKLKSALEKEPPSDLKAGILLRMAHLALDLNRPVEALEYCNQVVADPQLILYADEAIFQMARIFHYQLNDLKQAAELYDRILADFPESAHAAAAREKLKEIRSQLPAEVP